MRVTVTVWRDGKAVGNGWEEVGGSGRRWETVGNDGKAVGNGWEAVGDCRE